MRLESKKLALAAAGASLALAFVTTGAGAANRARAATGCPNETVSVFGTPTTLRFVLRGVSCSQAHSLIRTYFHDATIRSCRTRGNICAFDFPHGWTCSLPLYAGEGGGDFAGCFKSPLQRLRVFKVTRHARDPRDARVPPGADVASQKTWINASGCAFRGSGLVWAQHPATIGVTCDPHDQIVDARWRNWGQAEAQATAALAVDNCNPSCGGGRVRRYAITMLASKIGHCGARRVYTSVTFYEKVAGHRRAYPVPAEGFC